MEQKAELEARHSFIKAMMPKSKAAAADVLRLQPPGDTESHGMTQHADAAAGTENEKEKEKENEAEKETVNAEERGKEKEANDRERE